MDDIELAARLPDKPATTGPHPTVVVRTGSVDAVLERLLLHFEARPADELEVRRGEVALGYLDADTLYAIVPQLTRGIGDADHFALLGDPADELLALDCPVNGCSYTLSVVLYPVSAPPHCPHHPDSELQVRP